jgi:hypothetical protein
VDWFGDEVTRLPLRFAKGQEKLIQETALSFLKYTPFHPEIAKFRDLSCALGMGGRFSCSIVVISNRYFSPPSSPPR